MGALIGAVIFWDDSKDNWKKTSDVAIEVTKKTDIDQFNALKEQVNRQYQVQRERDADQDRQSRERDDRQDEVVKENSKWIEQQKGYHQALLDYGIIKAK